MALTQTYPLLVKDDRAVREQQVGDTAAALGLRRVVNRRGYLARRKIKIFFDSMIFGKEDNVGIPEFIKNIILRRNIIVIQVLQ